jgi:hypothetical protein
MADKVWILKHRKPAARVHETEPPCRWLTGPIARPDWAAYERVERSTVDLKRHRHCSVC